MNFPAALVAIFFAGGGPDALTVTLHVSRSSCHELITVTDDNRWPNLNWKGPSTLVVSVVRADTFNQVIAERGARAEISGADLRLCYNYEPPVVLPQDGTRSTCASPVRLEFTVEGVQSGSYKASISPCWPAG